MRGYVSSQIALFKNSKKIALSYNNEFSLSFEEFNIRMEYLKSFLDEISLPLGTRIGIIGLDLSYLYPYAIAVLDSYTLVLFENQSSVLKDFKEYEIDYILTEETNTDVRDFAFQNLTAVLTHNHGVFNKIGNSLFNHISSANVYGIVPTSGTTSKPKLIAKLHDNLISICQMHKSLYQYHETTVHLQLSPIERITTLNYSIYILINGSTSIINKLDFNTFFKTMNYKSVTIFKTVPSVLRKIVDYLESNGNKIGFKSNTLRYISVGGARLDHDLYMKASELFHTDIVQTYGSNETGTIASTYNLTKGYKQNSVGFVRYHEIKFIDDEICVKGNSVFEGYINYPNEDLFVDGWFKTGDIGYLDEDNYLFISGRKKEMINRGGEKVSPYEIEDGIKSLGLFIDFAVFPYHKDSAEEVGVLAISHQSDITIEDLRGLLIPTISSYKLPTLLIYGDHIPKNNNGKVERMKIEQLYEKHIESLNSVSDTSIFNPSQKVIYDIWCKVLKTSNFLLDNEFFLMGGDSLKLAEVFVLIENQYNIQMPMVDFNANKTIRSMSLFVQKYLSIKKKFQCATCLREGDSLLEPLFFFHSPMNSPMTYEELSKEIHTQRPIYVICFDMNLLKENLNITSDEIYSIFTSEVLNIQKSNTFYLAGLSLGGRTALEVALQLKNLNKEIGLCLLMDTVLLPNSYFNKLKIISHHILESFTTDIQDKAISQYKAIFKIKLINFYTYTLNRKKFYSNQLKSLNEKIEKEDFNFSRSELFLLFKRLYKTNIKEKYPFTVVYLLAKKSYNQRSYELLRKIVKSVVKYDLNCLHDRFITTHKIETASIIERLINS